MSIINILYETAILLACSLIQVFGVLLEGFGKLFKRCAELLETLHDKLVEEYDNQKKVNKKKANINVPL